MPTPSSKKVQRLIMRRCILIGLCALCTGLMASEGFAQYLNARAEGLGGTGVGLMGSGSAILYNPAGLAFMEDREANFTYGNWSNVRYYVAGIAANVPGKGTFGLSVQKVDSGNNISNYSVFGAYGFKMTDQFAVGTTLKLVHQEYPDLPQEFVFFDPDTSFPVLAHNVFAFDLGTYFVTGFRNTVMAMSVQNLSAGAFGESEQFELQKSIRAGLLIDLISMVDVVAFSHYLDLAADLNKPIYSDRRTNLHLGVEYTYIYQAEGYSVGLSLRVGQKTADIIESITWGSGLQFKAEGRRGIKVDYAFRSDDFFRDDDVHILGIALNF